MVFCCSSPGKLIQHVVYFFGIHSHYFWNSDISLSYYLICFHNAHGYNFLIVIFNGPLTFFTYISLSLKKWLLLFLLLYCFLLFFLCFHHVEFYLSSSKICICYLPPHLFSICCKVASPSLCLASPVSLHFPLWNIIQLSYFYYHTHANNSQSLIWKPFLSLIFQGQKLTPIAYDY